MDDTPADIGALLKTRRNALGLSLVEAAEQTRIRRTHLESIEKNQFSDLPGQAYAVGFVKVYARYLGLDSAAFLEELHAALPEAGRPQVRAVPAISSQAGRSRKPRRGGWGAFILGFLAVVLVGSAIYLLSPGSSPEEDVRFVAKPAVAEKEPEARMSEGAPAGTSAESGDAAPSLPTVLPDPPDNPVAPVAPGAPVVETGAAPLAGAPDVQDVKALPAVSVGGGSLRMLALAESSLIIYLDDRTPHEYRLHDGLDLTWKIKQKVRIELAGTGVARFWLDGQELELGGLDSFQLQVAAGE